MGGNVELEDVETRAADDRSDATRAGLDRCDRRGKAPLVIGEIGLDGCLSRRLCRRVVGREHPQTTPEQKIGALVEGGAEARILKQLPPDLFDEIAGGLPFGRHAPLGRQRCIDVAVVLLFGDVAGLKEAEEGDGAPLVGDVGESGWVVAVGVGDQPGEQRSLGPGQPIG